MVIKERTSLTSVSPKTIHQITLILIITALEATILGLSHSNRTLNTTRLIAVSSKTKIH